MMEKFKLTVACLGAAIAVVGNIYLAIQVGKSMVKQTECYLMVGGTENAQLE